MITFHPFNRWQAIAIDGTPVGYMSHIHGRTELHLKQDAPVWLNAVRRQGPWPDHGACQRAIKDADPRNQRDLAFGVANVLKFPAGENSKGQ